MFRTTIAAAAVLAAAVTAPAQAANVTVTGVTGSGNFFNSPSLLNDGNFALGTWWTETPNVYWVEQTGASGVVLTLSFDQLYTLTDVALGVDNNDIYQVQVSTNGTTWNHLLLSLPTSLDAGYEYAGQSMIKRTSVPGDVGYSALVDIAPVQARYARIFAISGDNSYAVSELRFTGAPVVAVPEPETYALMAAGLLAVGFAVRRRQR